MDKTLAIIGGYLPDQANYHTQTYTPGTKMGFAGIAAPQDRANLIAYLQTQGG